MNNTSIEENLKITNEKAGTKRDHKGLRKRHLNAINFMAKYLPKRKNISILDAGCREGLFLEKLKEIGYKNLYGVDISEKAIKILEKSIDAKSYVSDICNMPFGDDTFDLIICTHTLEHCENPLMALNELYRVSKNNSIVLLEVPIENVDSPRTNVGHFSSFKTEDYFLEFVSNKFEILNKEKDRNTNKHWFRVVGKSIKE